MRVSHKIAAGLAAFGLLAGATSASAAGASVENAEKIRKLDIMLMVSALRCRHSADGFQADYYDFTKAHLSSLNAASRSLEADLARRYGAAGAKRALDKLSTSMANSYGQGHPTMSCGQLKAATRDLARNNGAIALNAAADVMLADAPGRVALVARR